eukprot:scaffold349_cov29-Attheya_sp.AAC.3
MKIKTREAGETPQRHGSCDTPHTMDRSRRLLCRTMLDSESSDEGHSQHHNDNPPVSQSSRGSIVSNREEEEEDDNDDNNCGYTSTEIWSVHQMLWLRPFLLPPRSQSPLRLPSLVGS